MGTATRCFFFMLLLSNPIVGQNNGRALLLWKPIIERTVISWQLYWDDSGWKWKESEIRKNAARVSIFLIHVWKLILCLLSQFYTCLVKRYDKLKLMRLAKYINCQSAQEWRGHHLVWSRGLLANAPLMEELAFCQMMIIILSNDDRNIVIKHIGLNICLLVEAPVMGAPTFSLIHILVEQATKDYDVAVKSWMSWQKSWIKNLAWNAPLNCENQSIVRIQEFKSPKAPMWGHENFLALINWW